MKDMSCLQSEQQNTRKGMWREKEKVLGRWNVQSIYLVVHNRVQLIQDTTYTDIAKTKFSTLALLYRIA